MRKRILVVDDEISIQEALRKVLQAEDYEVVLAQTGPPALEKLEHGEPDLMLLDLGLPGKGGSRTLEWLAQVNPLLPIIIITGRHEDRALAEAAGVDATMEKPLNVPGLLQTIRELTDQPTERRVEWAGQRASAVRSRPPGNPCCGTLPRERLKTPYPGRSPQ